VFVAQHIPLQLHFDLLDGLATVIGNVHIDVYACTTDPYLPMQARCHSDDFNGSFSRLDPLVRGSEWTWEGCEGLLS
jgi:hypothetical protein